jgi:hypothetical protein
VLFSPGWRAPVRQGTVLAVFTSGLVAGGSASGLMLWLLSGLTQPLPPATGACAALACAALGVLRDAGVVRLPLPQNARQVPADLLRHRTVRGLVLGAFRFGAELGTGVRTYVPASAPYVVALALLLTHPGPGASLAAGAGFGLGRAGTAALGYASRQAAWPRRVATRLRWITTGCSTAMLTILTIFTARFPAA